MHYAKSSNNETQPKEPPVRFPRVRNTRSSPLNDCSAALYDAQVHNRIDLTGPWVGWRLRGRELVSPDGQRMSPQRLIGLLWREESEKRLAKARRRREAELARRRQQPVKVIVVELAELRVDGKLAG